MSSPECFANPPAVTSQSSSSGGGKVDEVGGLKTYITGPPPPHYSTTTAILLISDVFGFEAPKLRRIADKVAAASGFLVVVPDFLYGDPYDLSNPQFDRESWRKLHPTDKGYEDAKQVIAALKEKGVSAVGAAGVVVTKLASSTDLNAAVVLHPGRLTVGDIDAVKVPISFLGAEIDQAAPPEQLKQFGEILAAKNEFDSFVKIYPGVSHGWAVRYNDEDESAVKSAEEAHSDMLEWFVKHVK